PPARRSVVKFWRRRAVRQHSDDLRIIAERLVTTVRHAEQGLATTGGRKVEPEIRDLFVRRLRVEPKVARAELVLQHEVDKLLLRRQDSGDQPIVFEPEFLPEIPAE